MYQNSTTPTITASAGAIAHNRWTVSPSQKQEIREYGERLMTDAEEWMVNNPTTPNNHYEVVGRLSKEVRDLEHALDQGHAYKLSFEIHDLNVKSFCLKILSKNILTISR